MHPALSPPTYVMVTPRDGKRESAKGGEIGRRTPRRAGARGRDGERHGTSPRREERPNSWQHEEPGRADGREVRRAGGTGTSEAARGSEPCRGVKAQRVRALHARDTWQVAAATPPGLLPVPSAAHEMLRHPGIVRLTVGLELPPELRLV